MAEPRPRRDGGHPLWELTRARFLEFVRDPHALFWVFGFPVLLAVVLGIAFREKSPELPRVAVAGPAAAEVLARLASDETVETELRGEDEALAALARSSVDVVVIARPDANGVPSVEYRLDPVRPGARAAELAFDRALQRAYGRQDVLSTEERHVEEKGGRYIDFLLPGLIGLNIMGSCMWGMGYAIVDSRRRKLLKRFAVTPMNRAHFLLAFILSRLVFLAAEVAVLVAFGWLVFDVSVSGSVFTLGFLALLGTLAFSGLALLIASRTASTEVASGWMNFVQLPMWLVSGSFFAYDRFPEVLHPFIRALPLTAVNDASRAVMNEGATFLASLPQIGILAAWAIASFALALRFFRWQ